jgi:hypothetical protein
MSISSTRKVSSNSSVSSRVNKNYYATDNYSQHIETIDTTNKVFVKDEDNNERRKQENSPKQNNEQTTNYKSSAPDIVNSIEVIAATMSPEEQDIARHQNNNVNVYTNNQSIIHDKDIENTGRNYLKHFYEKNEQKTEQKIV